MTQTQRTITVALVANLVLAVAKLAAGLLSGSVALLAEAGHSLADSLNEVFLGISLVRGGVPADVLHPFGHARERFLWAFMAAISSFVVGGCLSIGLAIWALLQGRSEQNVLVAWVVLAAALVADGLSLLQGLQQARREARERHLPVWRYLLHSSDPALRAVVVEDTAALIGVGLAAGGLLLSQLVGNNTPDALAALLIGVLLAVTAFGLARSVADFLIGRSVPPERFQQVVTIVSNDPAVEQLLALQVVYSGPQQVIVAARVHPTPGLTLDQLTRAMDGLDRTLRTMLPEVVDVFIDVTAYRLDKPPTEPGSSSN
jgi:cation diffusion facilitator family transporter